MTESKTPAIRKASESNQKAISYHLVNPFTGAELARIKMLGPAYDRYLSPNFTDLDGNNRQDLTTCARSRLAGQFVCEMRRLNNISLIRTISLLDSQYYVDDWNRDNHDDNSNTQEIIVCEWHLDSKQLRCQVKDYAMTGGQAYVKDAAVNLVYVADYSKVSAGGLDQNLLMGPDTGFIGQNVYL